MNRWAGALVLPLLVGAVVALWLRFEPLSADDSGYRLEMDLVSPAGGSTWLQYDLGNGRNYHDRRNFWVTASTQPKTYRVALPSGVFRSFAILPPATVHQVLAGARFVAPDGTVVGRIPAVRDVPERGDIVIQPARPLQLLAPGTRTWRASALDWLLGAGAVLLLSEFIRRRDGAKFEERLGKAVQAAVAWTCARPRTTLFGAAVLAVAVNCHPVLFFGKSFVSPNNGILCLYDVQPTLPGAPVQPVNPWNGSDINATMWEHLPYSVVAHDAVLVDHEFPLWDRYVMCGLTFLGQGVSMVGDPLYWLTVLANGAAWAWDARFVTSKLLFCFGVGLVVWRSVRHLGIAALLAFSSAFIGYFSYRFNHPAFFSLCYAPWMLLCWLNAAEAAILRRAGWWALALVAANWLELNSGTAKEASMLLIAMNGAGALAILLRPEPWRLRGKKIGLGAASCAVFLAVSAPLWIVFLDALSRGYTIYDKPLTNQISPGLFIGLFDDLFFRQLMEKEWHVDPALNFLVLLGLCWAIADTRPWIRDATARSLLAVAVLALAIVFGVVPPSWIDRLPFFKSISHVDDTFICVAVVPLFVLAGFGLRNCLEHLRAPAVWRRDWQVTALLMGGLAALYFGTAHVVPRAPEFGLQLTRPTDFSPFFVRYALALFAAVMLLPWFVKWFLSGRGSRPAHALAIGLCLIILHFRHGMWLETKFGGYVLNPQQRVDLQAASPAVDLVRERLHEPGRTMGFGQILRPGFNIVLRLESTTGVEPVTMPELAQWYEAAGLGALSMWWPTVSKANIAAIKPFYDAMNVRYYFGSAADAGQPAAGLDKIDSSDLEVFESKSAWPRAFFSDRLGQYADVRQLLAWVKTGDGRPFVAVRAGDANVPAPSPDQASRNVVTARDYRLTSNTTSFTIEAPAAGVAVLNESFVADNFRAFVNGQRVPYFRANHIFKAVALPGPGIYRVQFEYWPRPLSAALWVAAWGLLAMIGGVAALWFVPNRAGPV